MNRRSLFWIALVLVIVVGVYLAGRGTRRSDTALDPNGTGTNGLKALVLLVQSYGADVSIVDGVPGTDRTVAFMAVDRLGSTDTANLRAWVRRGNTLVVTDPQSSFVPRLGGPFGVGAVTDSSLATGDCTIAALAKAKSISFTEGYVFRPSITAQHCFTSSPDAFIVATQDGSGTIVSVGGPSVFVNANLDRADNAYVAVSLLAPHTGMKVAFIRGGSLGGGSQSLWSLIRPGIRYGFLQLGLAFLLYACWQGRRLGRAVVEQPAIEIEGSELVTAVGHLLARTESPAYAAAVLRAQTRRDVARRIGGTRPDDTSRLAQLVQARVGGDSAYIQALLADSPVADEAQLIALAQQLERLREEVLSG